MSETDKILQGVFCVEFMGGSTCSCGCILKICISLGELSEQSVGSSPKISRTSRPYNELEYLRSNYPVEQINISPGGIHRPIVFFLNHVDELTCLRAN